MLTVLVEDHSQNVWMRAPMSPFSLSVGTGVTTGVTTGAGTGTTVGVTGVMVVGGWFSVKEWYASRLIKGDYKLTCLGHLPCDILMHPFVKF